MYKYTVFFLTLLACVQSPLLAQTASAPETAPEPGKIIFYRPKKAKGAAIRFNIDLNGQPMGSLSNGQILEKTLEPGEHSFAVREPSLDGQDYLLIMVEPGSVHYVKCEIKWGWPAGRPKFEKVSQTLGESAVSGLR